MNKIKLILVILFLSSANAIAGQWTSSQSNEVQTAIDTLDVRERRDPGRILVRLRKERILVTPAVTQVVNDPAYWTVITAATNVNGTGSREDAIYTPARRYEKTTKKAVYTHRILFPMTRSQIKKLLRNGGP